MSVETYMKGCIEEALAMAYNTASIAFMPTITRSNKTTVVLLRHDEVVVEIQPPSNFSHGGFSVYSFVKGMEGVYDASYTPRKNIGKIKKSYRSEGLTEKYTAKSLYETLQVK